MLFKLRRQLSLWRFNKSARRVLRTPPVRCRPDAGATVVTQLHPPDVLMYLVAIKTFTRFVPIRSAVVVGDRLSARDKDLIRSHVEAVELLDIESIDTIGLPRGGTWERLVTIVDRSASGYTIQLDADTITLQHPTEVLECITQNRSFTLGTAMGREVVTAEEAGRAVERLASADAHIQIAAELELHSLVPQPVYYVRGNSAFAGFAHGEFRLDALRDFSGQMAGLVGGRRWAEWGSEQVASNYLIANSHKPCVLPFERYRYFHPGARLDRCPFLHFMGTYRFSGGTYRRLALSAIAGLA